MSELIKWLEIRALTAPSPSPLQIKRELLESTGTFRFVNYSLMSNYNPLEKTWTSRGNKNERSEKILQNTSATKQQVTCESKQSKPANFTRNIQIKLQ